MADETTFGESIAETTVDYSQFRLDPANYSDDDGELPVVWQRSQHLRELVDREPPNPTATERTDLAQAILLQIRTLELYLTVAARIARKDPAPENVITLYTLMFPGEGRDNTGIKDLNDKVLGYALNSEFVAARQAAISAIFTGGDAGPGYLTVGQDYKTAFILAIGKKTQDVAQELVRLDAKLRELLLGFLVRAEKRWAKDAKRLAAIRALRKTLEKDKKYRFDYLFGSNAKSARGNALELTFLLITEALKGAGIARFAVKGRQLKTPKAQVMAGRGIPRVPRGHDDRGRPFDPDLYLLVSQAAPDIKKLMTKPAHRDQPIDLVNILINTVWTTCFIKYKRLFFGNPEVIRDVRKKALVRPTMKEGASAGFEIQKELLELWLVTLNMIDFISNFRRAEFDTVVFVHHLDAQRALTNVRNSQETVDWRLLRRILTRDVRQSIPVASLGSTSEFQFYSRTSDFQHQIIFVMDVRDLGVDLMLFYELANERVLNGKLDDTDLMFETFLSTTPTVDRKWVTYDFVVEMFRSHYEDTSARAGAVAEVAFGTPITASGPLPSFDDSVRFMLGGDEIFVSAHPLYAEHVGSIIDHLDRLSFRDQPLNLRVGVAHSAAKTAPGRGAPGSASFGPKINPEQRLENQKAHEQALKIAGDAPNLLKYFERVHNRISRLIDKLEQSKDTKKHPLAPEYRKKLDALGLLTMYARKKLGRGGALSAAAFARLRAALVVENMTAENVLTAVSTGDIELVDFADRPIDAAQLVKQSEALEKAVRKDVGRDNFHVELPPVTKIPKWIQKVIDILLPPEKIDPRPKPKLTADEDGIPAFV